MADRAGSYGRLILLCVGYFLGYAIFGVALKWLLDTRAGFPGMPGMEALFNTTVGGMSVALLVVLIFWWPGRLRSTMPRTWGGRLPGEYAWLIPSGICTGFVIPTTTLMYSYGYSVMVAMVLMRASLIVVGRVVDAILIRQGHLDKKVYWQENAAVIAAVAAMSLVLFGAGPEDFRFFESPPAMITMALYIVPYALRIYILNRFKVKVDHRAIFGIEQIFAALTVLIVLGAGILAYQAGWQPRQLAEVVQGVRHPSPTAILVGVPFGIIAFFSVFIFLYRTGTATFNTTLNRLTSLMAGTVATLAFHFLFQGRAVQGHQWSALLIVLAAIGFLAWAGRRRARKLDEGENRAPRPTTAGNPAS